jgi:hypothetical protein
LQPPRWLLSMEPQPKKRRLDALAPHHDIEQLNDESHNSRGDYMSNTFTGNGISNQNGNFNVVGDLTINYNSSPQKIKKMKATENDGRGSTSRIELLNSLRFAQINDRYWNIKNAQANTCRWLLQMDAYKQREEKGQLQNEKFLWVKGKPGAEKSALMKFLLVQLQNRIQYSEHQVLISFFSNARGSDSEQSTVGLYRSLLWQLFDRLPHLQHVLDDLQPRQPMDPWTT